MTLTITPMTDEQRKAIALEFIKRVDSGGNVLELFADDALFSFPKYGTVRGVDKIGAFFVALGGVISAIEHHAAYFNVLIDGDRVVLEGTSHGVAADGTPWRAGVTHAGAWCDVFEIRDFKIHRLFVYLDPDYAGADTERYPWLAD